MMKKIEGIEGIELKMYPCRKPENKDITYTLVENQNMYETGVCIQEIL